jgi:hypothetical protein
MVVAACFLLSLVYVRLLFADFLLACPSRMPDLPSDNEFGKERAGREGQDRALDSATLLHRLHLHGRQEIRINQK